MQTIKVTLPAVTAANDTIRFQVDNTTIATVSPDMFNKGKYCGNFSVFGCCNNVSAPDACEFICTMIESHFAGFGLNVEFVNA